MRLYGVPEKLYFVFILNYFSFIFHLLILNETKYFTFVFRMSWIGSWFAYISTSPDTTNQSTFFNEPIAYFSS